MCLPTFGEKWEINVSQLKFEELIGRGNHGVVYRGLYNLPTNDDSDQEETKVAIKSLKGRSCE